MFYTPKVLDKHLIRDLKRLNEEDRKSAIKILQQRIADLRNADYYLEIPVDDLPFSTKAYLSLMNHKLETVKDILEYGWDDLAKLRGVGPRRLAEIRAMIEGVVKNRDKVRGLSGIDLGNVILDNRATNV
jgi:ERCC4-type nuclease